MSLMALVTLRDVAPVFFAEYRPRLRKHFTDPAIRRRVEAHYLMRWRSCIRHFFERERDGRLAIPAPPVPWEGPPQGGLLGDMPLETVTKRDLDALHSAAPGTSRSRSRA